MVREHQIVIGVQDFRKVRFRCGNKQCTGEFTLDLSPNVCLPDKCPSCTHPWLGNDGATTQLLNALSQGRGFVGSPVFLELIVDEDVTADNRGPWYATIP